MVNVVLIAVTASVDAHFVGQLDPSALAGLSLVFPLLMILFARFTDVARALLRRGSFWICIAVSLLFLTPVVWWNAQSRW